MGAKTTAGAFGLGFVNLPPSTKFHLQQEMLKIQSGTKVRDIYGLEIDVREEIANGSKHNHRVSNNNLHLAKQHTGENCIINLQNQLIAENSVKVGSAVAVGARARGGGPGEGVGSAVAAGARTRGDGTGEGKESTARGGMREGVGVSGEVEVMNEIRAVEIIELSSSGNGSDTSFASVTNVNGYRNPSSQDDGLLLNAKADEMAVQVVKRMRNKYTEELSDYQKCKGDDKSGGIKKELKKLKKSIMKVDDEFKNKTHVNMIKRVTSDGDKLLKDDDDDEHIDSQEVMEILLTEHELDDGSTN